VHQLLRDSDRNADPPKLDVAGFQRVLVAGFISGGTDDVDSNLETTRLLRSQLRTKSDLRVIDADVLPLMEVANEGQNTDSSAPARRRRRSRKKRISSRTSVCSPTSSTGRRSARNISSLSS
jgi:hypothetical protein